VIIKNVSGKVRFFRVWGNPDAALQNHLRQALFLSDGHKVRSLTLSPDSVTVKQVVG
jgi:hypothetical protein